MNKCFSVHLNWIYFASPCPEIAPPGSYLTCLQNPFHKGLGAANSYQVLIFLFYPFVSSFSSLLAGEVYKMQMHNE
jgi:hypothetical protein